MTSTVMPPASNVPIRDRSTSPMSAILYSPIFFVLAKMASVIFSGAGPPLPMLYLMPKSSCGPPGLWLADRTRPPKASYLRMTLRGGRRRENASLPDHHLAETVRGSHGNGLLDDLDVEEAAVAADDQCLALKSIERVEDRLDEVLSVVLLLEHRHLLAQAGCAGLLVAIGFGLDGPDHGLRCLCGWRLSGEKILVEVGIFFRTAFPRNVGLHPLPLEGSPDIRVLVHGDDAVNGLQQGRCAVRLVHEPGRDTCRDGSLVCVDHRIRQSTGSGDDRHAAIAQTVELGQPAGFEARWDEDRVGAALHQMRQRLIIADHDADAAAMARGGGQHWPSSPASPDPRMTSLAPAATSSSAICANRSMPFCQVSRLTTQNIGPSLSSRPKRSSTAWRFAARFSSALAV